MKKNTKIHIRVMKTDFQNGKSQTNN